MPPTRDRVETQEPMKGWAFFSPNTAAGILACTRKSFVFFSYWVSLWISMSLGLLVELFKSSFIFADIFSPKTRGRGIKTPNCKCKAVCVFNCVTFFLVDLEISSGGALTPTAGMLLLIVKWRHMYPCLLIAPLHLPPGLSMQTLLIIYTC